MTRQVPERFLVAFSLAGEQRNLIRPVAEAVEQALGPSTVFFDEWFEHYIAGHDGDARLQRIYADRSALVIVCVSGQYGGKPWTQAEHEAIRARLHKARATSDEKDDLAVLPLRVGDGEVQGVHLNTIAPDLRLKTPAAAAQLIIDRLGLLGVETPPLNPSPAQHEPAKPTPQLRTSGDYLHAFGQSIDRVKQWGPVVRICTGNESAMFLVHGHQRQCVELFTYRVWHYLNHECGKHHEFVSVPLRVEYSKPGSSAAWLNHLRVGLSAGAARADDALLERARQAPVFLVLSEYPLEQGDLSEEELNGLTDFLDSRLPELMKRAAQWNPIRTLLTTQYADEKVSLVRRLDAAIRKGADAHGLKYEWLPALEDVGWSDIEAFLMNRSPRPPGQVFEQVRAAFQELSGKQEVDFRDLVERLSRKLY